MRLGHYSQVSPLEFDVLIRLETSRPRIRLGDCSKSMQASLYLKYVLYTLVQSGGMHASSRMRIRNCRCLLRIANVKACHRQRVHPRRTSRVNGELVILAVNDPQPLGCFICRS